MEKIPQPRSTKRDAPAEIEITPAAPEEADVYKIVGQIIDNMQEHQSKMNSLRNELLTYLSKDKVMHTKASRTDGRSNQM